MWGLSTNHDIRIPLNNQDDSWKVRVWVFWAMAQLAVFSCCFIPRGLGPPKMFQVIRTIESPDSCNGLQCNYWSHQGYKNHWLLRIFILTVWNNQRRLHRKRPSQFHRGLHMPNHSMARPQTFRQPSRKKGGMSGMSLARLDWNGQGIPENRHRRFRWPLKSYITAVTRVGLEIRGSVQIT